MAMPLVTGAGCTADTCFQFAGQNVVFKRLGSGNKEKVVLCGGAVFDDAEQWRFVQPELANKYDVVAFDYLGWGRSAHPNARITMLTQAEVVLAMMDYLKWDRAHIVGFSLGATVPQTLAKTPQYKGRILDIELINGVGILTPPPAAEFPQQSALFFANLPGTGAEGLRALLTQVQFQKDRITEEFIKDTIKLHLRYHGDRVYDFALYEGFPLGIALTTPFDFNSFTGVPFGLVWSANDGNQNPDAWESAYKSIPGVVIQQRMPNCGHNAIIECPQLVVDRISKWVDAHPTTPAPMDMGTTD